jgi:hypothetical protein
VIYHGGSLSGSCPCIKCLMMDARSHGRAQLFARKPYRAVFVISLVFLVNKYEFDGVIISATARDQAQMGQSIIPDT